MKKCSSFLFVVLNERTKIRFCDLIKLVIFIDSIQTIKAFMEDFRNLMMIIKMGGEFHEELVFMSGSYGSDCKEVHCFRDGILDPFALLLCIKRNWEFTVEI